MRMWWNGRHDSLRSYWSNIRGGSSPLIRTKRLFLCVLSIVSSLAILSVMAFSVPKISVVRAQATTVDQFTVTAIPKISKDGKKKQINVAFPSYQSATQYLITVSSTPETYKSAATGTLSYDFPKSGTLKDGNYTVTVQAKDSAGKTLATSSQVTRTIGASILPVTTPVGTGCNNERTILGTDVCNLQDYINVLVTKVSYQIGPLLASFAVLFGGIQYVSSEGDEAKAKAAKELIYSALLGLMVLLLAGTIMRGFFLST